MFWSSFSSGRMLRPFPVPTLAKPCQLIRVSPDHREKSSLRHPLGNKDWAFPSSALVPKTLMCLRRVDALKKKRIKHLERLAKVDMDASYVLRSEGAKSSKQEVVQKD